MSDSGVRTEEEDKLCSAVEAMTGGHVIHLERQVRWRPAWFIEVDTGGERLKLHARGDRRSDINPFPELEREAHILAGLEEVGVMVPHVYGFCSDPQAIIMDTIAGTRDVSEAANDAERLDVAKQYIDEIVRMHKAPLQPFTKYGITAPDDAEGIALAGLHAYEPLYRRTKKRAEPLIEFGFAWLRRNIPAGRSKASFVQYDCGQFLFDKGKLTGLFDFEFAMISDPMIDLATMRMRESYEPLGAPFAALVKLYEQATGEKVDDNALLYHNAVFAAVATSQFAGAIAAPKPGDPHDVYLEFSLALRRVLTKILAEAMGMTIEAPDIKWMKPAVRNPHFEMLEDVLEAWPAGEPATDMKKSGAKRLSGYMEKIALYGHSAEAERRREAEILIGRPVAEDENLDAILEDFVLSASMDDEAALLRFFYRDSERNVQMLGDTEIGHSAKNVHLPPIR